MRLVDYYHDDLVGRTDKDRLATKRLWHRAAVRALYLLSITSDTLSPLPSRRVHVDPRDKNSDTYEVTTIPWGRFFLSKPIDELTELYRVTKSPGRAILP